MAFSTGINRVELLGWINPAFKKPAFELQKSKNEVSYIKVSISIERPMPSTKQQSQDVKRQYDYVTCTAYGRTAEYIAKYCTPGSRVFAVGAIQTGKYNGQYTMDVRIDSIYSSTNVSGEDGRKPYENPRVQNNYGNDPVMSEYMTSGNAINPDDLPF